MQLGLLYLDFTPTSFPSTAMQSELEPSTGPMLQFSCTLVHKPYDSTMEVQDSHTFPDLSLDQRFFVSRSGSMSIHINSLLATIQAHIFEDSSYHQNLSPTFHSIFQRRNLEPLFPAQFDVATSRVPDFDRNIKNPTNGYRFLGNLGSFSFQYTLHGQSQRISSREEVLAVGADRNMLPAVLAFLSVWEPFGINLDMHFIVILHPTTSAIPVLPPALLSPSTIHNNSPPFLHIRTATGTPSSRGSPSPLHHVATPIPPMPHEAGPPLNHTLLLASSLHSNIGSPSFSTPQSHSLSPLVGPGYEVQEQLSMLASVSALASEEPFINSNPPFFSNHDWTITNGSGSATGSTLIHGDGATGDTIVSNDMDLWSLIGDVDVMLESYNVSAEERAAAVFSQRRGSLLLNIQNFYALRNVISKLGLGDILTTTSNSYSSKDPKSRLTQVIQHFGWNTHSISHKVLWFKFATEISQMTWRKIPTSGCKCKHLLFEFKLIHGASSYSS